MEQLIKSSDVSIAPSSADQKSIPFWKRCLKKINLAVLRCSIGAPMRPFHGLGLEEVQVDEASQLFITSTADPFF